VENARAVRLDPPVEALQPGFNRCFYLTPARTTTYRLIAEGFDSASAAALVTVVAKDAAPIRASDAATYHGSFTLIFASAAVPPSVRM
jgi:hypothetical protein